MGRPKKNHYLYLLAAILSLCIPLLTQNQEKQVLQTAQTGSFYSAPSHGAVRAVVRKVIDGDTLELQGGEKVRLIGIDTMETSHNARIQKQVQKYKRTKSVIAAQGKEAKQAARSMLEGKTVLIDTDKEKRDRYHRLLGYVYLEDHTFVNAEMIRRGYAAAYRYPPNTQFSEYFAELEKQAQVEQRGIWA